MARSNIYIRKHNEEAWSKLSLGQKSELVNKAVEYGVVPMAVEPIEGMRIPPMQSLPKQRAKTEELCNSGNLIPEGRDKCMNKYCDSCSK